MIVKIVRKFAEGPDGVWQSPDSVPQKVLLETDQGVDEKDSNGDTVYYPAIKVGCKFFYFGKAHDKVTKYRILAIGTSVVCIQE